MRKSKKVSKYRGHTTHGGGHRKKRRGAGSRGGRGRAGTGKRASHKKEALGGKRSQKSSSKTVSINLSRFTELFLERLVKQEKVKKEGDLYVVNLSQLGYTKLLGTGSLKTKVKFQAKAWSPRAEEKVKAAGGEISA